MKTQNTLKALRRNLLGVATVVGVGATAYLLQKDGGTQFEVASSGAARGGETGAAAALQDGPSGSSGANGSSGGSSTSRVPSKGEAASHQLLRTIGQPSGSPLVAAGANPDADKGRVARLSSVALAGWSRLHAGDVVLLPGFDGAEPMEGAVNVVQLDNGWIRVGGELKGHEGSFSLNTNGSEVFGRILLPSTGVGYTIRMDAGTPVLVETRLSTLVCYPGMNPQAAAATSDGVARKAVAAAITVPVLNTRPGAKGVVYVDFDGESVTDPDWNGGRTINAAPMNFAAAEVAQVLAISAQDYAPFDVTFTTDRALYNATAVGARMRVIVTPTDTAAPGSGGVAYINSWSGAGGGGFKTDVVCWVFNQSVRSVAEALSHELGHTLGLYHDGQTNGNPYYAGHGGGLTTPTSWAPIMGVGYYRSLVQWSKGEYSLANNTEDDMAIIARPANRFGYLQSELLNGAKSLSINGSTFQNTGLLRNQDSVDSYGFTTTGGIFTAAVLPEAADTDLDAKLELQDAVGNTLQLADAPTVLGASLNKTLAAGSYNLVIRGAGTGLKPAGGYTTGYSAYGSTGRYVLSGSLQGGASLPAFTSPKAVTGSVGAPLVASIGVTGGATVTVDSSVLPAGLAFDARTLVLSGTPTQTTGNGTPGAADGPGFLRLVATNASGSTTGDFLVTVLPASVPLVDAFPAGGVVSTSAAAPWAGISMERADGSPGTVARSGLIANKGVTSMAFDYTPRVVSKTGGSVMTFYWKASTEPLGNRNRSGDFAQCRVNGMPAADAETGKALLLSGETGWVKQTVRLRASGTQRVEFSYSKDASLSAGQDRVWVYVSAIGHLPSVTTQPTSVQLRAGETSFTLSAAVSGAESITWKRNFVTLADGTSETGSVLSGTTTPVLKVSNAGGADVGYYWLEARNTTGSVITVPVAVVIAVAPVITQQPAAPVGLKLGDPLLLNANVSSASRVRFRWLKDGSPVAAGMAEAGMLSLSVPKTKANAPGKYQLVVSNAYGEAASVEVTVAFSGATITAKKKQ
jgi:hypothetical protein